MNMFTVLKKILYQPIRPVTTTAPMAYVLKDSFLSKVMGMKPFSSIMYVIPRLRKKFTQLDTNERIVELPFIYRHIPQDKRLKILDVGCLENTVSISLATVGHTVTGVDIREYELTHPNFHFIQADICQAPLAKNSYDFAISLSTVEHIGLDTMYGKSNATTSDTKALSVMHASLKKGGILLLTVPVANSLYVDSFMRRYTPKKLEQMLRKFSKVSIEYYTPDAQHQVWLKSDKNRLPEPPEFGVALISAQK